MKITIEADYNTMIQRRGVHNGVIWLIQQHSFRYGNDLYLTPSAWCTYIILTDEMHEEMRSKIEEAPWNGGQTFYKKITEEHINVSSELAEKWNKPYWKIGDDFQHIWDNERYDMYDFSYMESHIKGVINFLTAPSGER